MYVQKQWTLKDSDDYMAAELGRTLGVSPVLGQLLLNRGLSDADEARRFLLAPLDGLHDPAQLPGVTEAARRIHSAVKAGKRIVVYGDYDVDGMAATTILWRCLQLAGASVDYYVPHRLEEGYGLNSDALLKVKKQQGADVVVTVDCGIASCNEAKVARELGMELIITDHHEFGPELPEADVLVHPRLPESEYPFGDLCGAGVAFKLAWAICKEFSQAPKVADRYRSFLVESVILAGLGSVADVVPLLDENRIFVRYGLKSLRESPTVGLKALLDVAGLNGRKEIVASDIGFQLAPRLNAVGRLCQARLGVELLGTSSAQRATDLARYMNEQNDLRRSLERKITSKAREMVESNGLLDTSPALVLADPDWHPGVIGIVAGRLAERYARPVLLISQKENPGQGSGRSVPGFALHEALAECHNQLESHGGHPAACGFRILDDKVDSFREQFCEYVARQLTDGPTGGEIQIDVETPLNAVTVGFVKRLSALEPFGQGNPRPVFLSSGLQVVGEPRKVGGGERHLQFKVRQEYCTAKAIAFSMADRMDELMAAQGRCSLVYTPKINEWQGRVSVDLEIIDLRAEPVEPRL